MPQLMDCYSDTCVILNIFLFFYTFNNSRFSGYVYEFMNGCSGKRIFEFTQKPAGLPQPDILFYVTIITREANPTPWATPKYSLHSRDNGGKTPATGE